METMRYNYQTGCTNDICWHSQASLCTCCQEVAGKSFYHMKAIDQLGLILIDLIKKKKLFSF